MKRWWRFAVVWYDPWAKTHGLAVEFAYRRRGPYGTSRVLSVEVGFGHVAKVWRGWA